MFCIHETHRDKTRSRPHIPGITLVTQSHRNSVFVAPDVNIKSTKCSTQNGFEVGCDRQHSQSAYILGVNNIVIFVIDTLSRRLS